MKLLATLQQQKSDIEIAIRVIERMTHAKNETAATAERIRKAVYKARPARRKGKHWTQTPEGKRRLAAVLRARWAKRKSGDA